MENPRVRFAQISDTHITEHKNLLVPMIASLNREKLDFVVVTGDLIHDNKDENMFKAVASLLNEIKTKVFVLPGDYDGGEVWNKTFGQPPRYFNIDEFCVEFVDTSFMHHRFSVGWADCVEKESPEQYAWLKERLKIDKWHLVFSHHPAIVSRKPDDIKKNYTLLDNVRLNYCGHLREPVNYAFTYIKKRPPLEYGVACIPLKYHGNACYNLVTITDKGEIAHTPRALSVKMTVW